MNDLAKIIGPVAPTTPCKVCGEDADLYGVADFNKSCEELRQKYLRLSGVPVYYHRCSACGFIFTCAFDHWTSLDFKKHVYNDDYILVDPEYAEIRPGSNAGFVAGLIGNDRALKCLDYGGGNGDTARFAEGARYRRKQLGSFRDRSTVTCGANVRFDHRFRSVRTHDRPGPYRKGSAWAFKPAGCSGFLDHGDGFCSAARNGQLVYRAEKRPYQPLHAARVADSICAARIRRAPFFGWSAYRCQGHAELAQDGVTICLFMQRLREFLPGGHAGTAWTDGKIPPMPTARPRQPESRA